MSKITVDGIERDVNVCLIKSMVDDQLYNEYSVADRNTIVDCVRFLIADLTVDTENMQGLDPEAYYLAAAIAYLRDGHTVYDLDNIEDDAEVFKYAT